MIVRKPYYPVLEAEIAKNGVRKKDIAIRLGITQKTLVHKLAGKQDFWLKEVCIICSIFPGVSAEQLFSHAN